MSNSNHSISEDIALINRIPVVPTILEVICRTTGMGFAAIARVTDEKWIACSVRDEINFGLKPGGELLLESTICHEIRQSGEGVVIDHVAIDPHFKTHHTPAMYGFESYISMPIILKDGSFFGTLCAIDPRPAKLNNPETIGMFKLYADLLSFHVNALNQIDLSEKNLIEQQKIAEVREQFIAILGHDLRNPLSAISGSAQLLMRMQLNERGLHLANMIKNSSFRMKGLVENMLDFASGRLGEGIILNKSTDERLENILNQVVNELHINRPGRIIETDIKIIESINCDGKRIAQLLSNLLSNALMHGDAEKPVKVTGKCGASGFELSVINSGEKISDDVKKHLFQPFSRGNIRSGQDGLGLGLYIVSEIARAHNGTMEVDSNDEQTCFTFKMPVLEVAGNQLSSAS